MTHSPTNEPKTAEQFVKEAWLIAKSVPFEEQTGLTGYNELIVHMTDAAKSYAQQECRELVEALEKIVAMKGGTVGIDSPNNHSNIAKQALNQERLGDGGKGEHE